METFVLPAGKYAIFLHKGKSVSAFIEKIKTILSQWLPNSEYEIDNRPDFEISGRKTLGIIPRQKRKFGYRLSKVSVGIKVYPCPIREIRVLFF